MSLVAEIESRMQSLKPTVCVCDDESHLHIGHAGNKGGGHYALLVVSAEFEGVMRVARQQIGRAHV